MSPEDEFGRPTRVNIKRIDVHSDLRDGDPDVLMAGFIAPLRLLKAFETWDRLGEYWVHCPSRSILHHDEAKKISERGLWTWSEGFGKWGTLVQTYVGDELDCEWTEFDTTAEVLKHIAEREAAGDEDG